jgi:hypothetical protein
LAYLALRIYPRPVVVRWFAVVFVASFIYTMLTTTAIQGNRPPTTGDGCEYHNLAWSLAKGRGYRYDWNDQSLRSRYEAYNQTNHYDFLLVRRGARATAMRPPLLPLLAAPVVLAAGEYDFLVWRILDAVLLASATSLASVVALRVGGLPTSALAAVFCCFDCMREATTSALQTEGLCYFGISVLLYLITTMMAAPRRWQPAAIGLAFGLLCLTRSIFVLLLPVTFVFVAWSWPGAWGGMRGKLLAATASLVFAILTVSPWWIRNCIVLESAMPLGTQGGFNLPDEYGEIAWNNRGRYTGQGIGVAWERRLNDEPALNQEYEAAALSSSELESLGHGRGVAFGKALFANCCGSIRLEREICLAGESDGMRWIRSNFTRIPRFAFRKFRSECEPWKIVLIPQLVLALFALVRADTRRWALAMLVVFLGGIDTVMLTHSVGGRFIVPFLPALYILSSIGAVHLVLFLKSMFRESSGSARQTDH